MDDLELRLKTFKEEFKRENQRQLAKEVQETVAKEVQESQERVAKEVQERVEKEVEERVATELNKRDETRDAHRDWDAQIWAQPFIYGTASEAIRRLLKSERKFPRIQKYKAHRAASLIGSKEQKVDADLIVTRFERIINIRNETTHCSSDHEIGYKCAMSYFSPINR